MLRLAALKEVMNDSNVCLIALYDNGINAWSYPVVTRFYDFCSWLIGSKSYLKSHPQGSDDGMYPLYFKFPEAYDVYICGKFNLASDCSVSAFDVDKMPIKLGTVKEIIEYVWSETDV